MIKAVMSLGLLALARGQDVHRTISDIAFICEGPNDDDMLRVTVGSDQYVFDRTSCAAVPVGSFDVEDPATAEYDDLSAIAAFVKEAGDSDVPVNEHPECGRIMELTDVTGEKQRRYGIVRAVMSMDSDESSITYHLSELLLAGLTGDEGIGSDVGISSPVPEEQIDETASFPGNEACEGIELGPDEFGVEIFALDATYGGAIQPPAPVAPSETPSLCGTKYTLLHAGIEKKVVVVQQQTPIQGVAHKVRIPVTACQEMCGTNACEEGKIAEECYIQVFPVPVATDAPTLPPPEGFDPVIGYPWQFSPCGHFSCGEVLFKEDVAKCGSESNPCPGRMAVTPLDSEEQSCGTVFEIRDHNAEKTVFVQIVDFRGQDGTLDIAHSGWETLCPTACAAENGAAECKEQCSEDEEELDGECRCLNCLDGTKDDESECKCANCNGYCTSVPGSALRQTRKELSLKFAKHEKLGIKTSDATTFVVGLAMMATLLA